MIGTVIYSIGGTFFGRDNRLIDYSVAESALLLASLAPGYSRPIPGAHWALRACEWAVMGAALVSTAAVIVGDITYHGVRHAPYNMPWNVAVGAALATSCFFTILLVSKERARRKPLTMPPCVDNEDIAMVAISGSQGRDRYVYHPGEQCRHPCRPHAR